MSKEKRILLNFSISDYNKLVELSMDSNMKISEFIRTMIQVTYVANKGLDFNSKIEIGGYGITFPPEIIEDFGKRLAQSLENYDFSQWESQVQVTESERNYKPKRIPKKIAIAKTIKKTKKAIK